MVRMTDLLKKAKLQEEILERKPAAPPLAKEERPLVKKERISKEKRPPEEPVKFAELVTGPAKGQTVEKEAFTREFMRAPIPDEEETKKLYFEAIESMGRIFNAYKEGQEIDRDDITNTAQKIVNNIIMGSHLLLKLFHELDSLEDYIYYNAVNVSALSVEIGIVYKYNKSVLLNLAIVGLLHDMDLIKNKHIIEKPQKLEEKELKEITKHPLNIASYVDHAFNFSKDIVNAILQHHERRSGQGYPAGLVEEDIHDLAEIVGIADTYEAMIHSRPYKEKMAGHAAVLNIINYGKELFSNEAIKALVACIGLYPVGSWVELNTGEICKVLMINPDSPLRPVISIVMDKDRNKYREVRTINLQKTPSLYIKEAIEKGITS